MRIHLKVGHSRLSVLFTIMVWYGVFYNDDISYNIQISLSSFIITFFQSQFSMHFWYHTLLCVDFDDTSSFYCDFVWNDLSARGCHRDMELTSELDNSQLQDQLRRLMVNISLHILGSNLHDKIWSFKRVRTWPQNKIKTAAGEKIGISSRF